MSGTDEAKVDALRKRAAAAGLLVEAAVQRAYEHPPSRRGRLMALAHKYRRAMEAAMRRVRALRGLKDDDSNA